MKKKQTLRLIDGTFTASEAKEVLMNVFSSKIQFHQRKNFSSKERFGKDDEVAVRRMPELKNSLHKIAELFSEAESKHYVLTITSDVNIVIKKAKEKVVKEKPVAIIASEKKKATKKPADGDKKEKVKTAVKPTRAAKA